MAPPSEEDAALARLLSVRAAMFFPDDDDRQRRSIDASFARAAQDLLETGFHKSLDGDEAIGLFELARESNSYDSVVGAALRKVRRNHMTPQRGAAEPPGRLTPILAGSIAANALIIP